MALKDQLSDLREMSGAAAATSPQETATPAPAGQAASARALALETASSGGADAAAVGASNKQVELGRRNVKQIAVADQAGGQQVAQGRTPAKQGRSREEIRQVFDANKSTIFRIYQRELRQNPALQGTLVPELTIEPDGAVSKCRIVKSNLGAPALEAKICSMLQLMQFEAKSGIDQYVVPYPIDLIPG